MEQAVAPASVVVEDSGSLLKELSLLGEEQRESGQIHLLVVCFYLRKVGVDRQIEREVVCDIVLKIDADFPGLYPCCAGKQWIDRSADCRHRLRRANTV